MHPRFASICVSILLSCACSSAFAQSFGDIFGRLGTAWFGLREAYLLERARAPDGPFLRRASEHDQELVHNLGKLLPPGTDLLAAATGFRNLGEFVTAVRASSNLTIPFDKLKAKIVAGNDVSDAIELLRPEIDGLVEARRARRMARQDLSRT